MDTFGYINNEQNEPFKFFCEICDYKCSKKSNFDRHIVTSKHLKRLVLDTKNEQNEQNEPNKEIKLYKKNYEINENETYICSCGMKYKYSQGLSKHKKKCKFSSENKNIDKEMILMILNQNNELQKQIIELCKNGIHSNNSFSNVNNVNSNNKSFNLNFFLNETCKNAMNIMDFANSIQLNLTDLEKVGELGYVEGISKIIIDNLKLLDITERPVHCSDFKRDALYVKDNDKWEKENINNEKMKKVINYVTNKNISLIPEWKQKYPECKNINSKKSTQINKMIMEVMETDKSKNDKIIKNIAKEVTINKE